MPLDTYWTDYDATLRRVATERPATFADLKPILDAFQPPSSGDAFFPGGGDDDLMGALTAAGWVVIWARASYFYAARHPDSGAVLTYIEGDVYEGNRR